MLRTLLLISILALAGCSTTRDQAKDLMEGKSFYKARTKWVSILRKDPTDTEALKMKAIAEREYIGQELIKIRDLGKSGHVENALETADELNKTIKEWGTKIEFNGANFYRSEINRLRTRFLGILEKLEENKKALRIQSLVGKYKYLFGSSIEENVTQILKRTKKIGKENCQNLKPFQRSGYYINLFTYKYCKHFNAKVKNRWKASPYYKLGSVKVNLRSNKRFLKNEVKQAFEGAFEQSLWNSSKARKKVNLNMVVNASSSDRVRKETRIHEYQKELNYNTYDDVTRVINKPYTEEELKCAGADCRRYTVQKERSVTVTNKEKVTRQRYVLRQYYYPVLKHNQKFKIDGELSFNLDGEKILIPYSSNHNLVGISHNTTFREGNLYPQRLELKNDTKWFQGSISSWREAFERELNQRWILKHCHQEPKIQHGKSLNDIIACAMIDEKKVNSDWISKTFDLSFLEIRGLLKI